MKKAFLHLIICIPILAFAQDKNIQIYPTNWWVGMKNNNVQLMIHSHQIGNLKNFSISYPGVKLEKIHKVENSNYVFLDLKIDPTAKAGLFMIKGDKNVVITYELKARRTSENGKTRIKGVTSSDLVYLLMPDRFSNGDTTNDRVAGMIEEVNSRDSLKGRHGGDLKGIQNHLDYLKDLGVTTIWPTPVIINNMKRESFHGYAFTDQYTIDPRFGGEAAYHSLIEASHKIGLKVIQDAVYNHVGINHVILNDMPMKDWLNQWPSYQNTSYKDQTLMDPYASPTDRKIMTDGWFTPFMPDMNQRNPYVANYLIQYAIWATENYGIDGWRIDTYPYCDRDFMNRCNKALLDEYPQIGIFAETWVHGVLNQSFFTRNNLDIPFKSTLPGVTDFQVHFAMIDALTQNYGWAEGLSSLYSTLADDFVYKDPNKNCIFLDNHDMTRFFSAIGEDFDKYRMGINWLLTLRGIPELYYGTEILMSGTTNPSDAYVRKDFPGGWEGDKVNKFSASGRTDKENEAFSYVKTLANFRLHSSAITSGKLMQYVPYDGLYVYFRYDDKQTVMVVANSNDKAKEVKIKRFAERLNGFSKMKNIITGEVSDIKDFNLAPKGSGVYEMMR